MRTWSRCLAAATLGVSLTACDSARSPHRSTRTEAPNPQIQAAVGSKARPAFVGSDAQARAIWDEASRFYEQTGYQLAWSDLQQPRPVMDALIRGVRAAAEEGLDPADYDIDALAAAREGFDPAKAADVDLRFTYAYLKYGWHLARGTIKPEDVDPKWHAAGRNVDLAAAFRQALDQNRIEESLKALAPAAPPYHGLRTRLARYRAMAEAGGSHTIADAPQAAELKLTVTDVIRVIRLNMDRWRWMPEELGARYVFVNIPAFRLDVFENGKSVLDMKVVTGRQADPTPVLVDQITHLIFSPYWNIPAGIVKNEIMPKLADDPGYLDRNNIEMVSGSSESGDIRFRQRPGPGNALGQVKFMFPNHFNVYLHDTPADALFNRVERDFSHGCVRIERPFHLAKYLLRDQPDWTDERITRAMSAGVERTVKFTEPVPIYLAYFTAWEDHGALRLRPDVYSHDLAQQGGAR